MSGNVSVSASARASLLGALLLIPLALAGCDGPGPSIGLSSTYEKVKGKFKTAAESRMETRDKRRADMKSTTVLSFSGEPGRLTVMEAAQDLGLIRNRQAEAYMRRVLNRVASKWPYEAPKVGVFVRANDGFGASSTSTDILVPIVVFEGVESEDQLAAILAHELSHILLRHHEQIDQQRALTKGIATAGSLATTMAYASEMDVKRNGAGQVQVGTRDAKAAENRALYAVAAQMTLQTLVNDVVGPGWSRTQESEADLLAIDLMEASGYDGRAMIEVLRKLGAAEDKRRKQAEDYSKKYGPMIASAMASMSTGSVFAVMQTVAVDAGASTLSAVGDRLRRDHPDPETRVKDVQAYLNREYADALHEEIKQAYAAEWRAIKPVREMYRPVFEANDEFVDDKLDSAREKIERALSGPVRSTAVARFVAYKIYLKKGDNAAAYRQLMAIGNWGDAPMAAYAALAQHHAMHGQLAAGEGLLNRAAARFQSEDVVLPSRIAMYRAAGRSDQAQAQLALCQKSEDSDIKQSCEAAAKSATNEVVVAKKDETTPTTLFSTGSVPLLGAITGRIAGQ